MVLILCFFDFLLFSHQVAFRNRSFNDERTTSEINKDAIVLIKSREKSRFIRKPITEPIIHAVEEVSEKMTV